MNEIKVLREKIKKLKVLFVDDEVDIRNGTGIFLRKFFDTVVICGNGKEGLETFLNQQDFDVVITDIVMPVLDGIEMSKEIRKIDPQAYIVILTASRGTKDLEKNISNMTLQKPLSFEDMLVVMNQLESRND